MTRVIKYVVVDYDSMMNSTPGIAKKVKDQIVAMREKGYRVDLISVGAKPSLLAKINRRLPLMPDGIHWDASLVYSADFIYIRRPRCVSREFIRFLKAVRRSPNCKGIVYEIPTYPYDKEDTSGADIFLHFKDFLWRRRLAKFVDRVVDLSGHQRIFGIQTIQIRNGIDLRSLKERKTSLKRDGTVNIAFVASFATWHGADRLLEGLAQYVCSAPMRAVYVHLVGDGPALTELKTQAVKRGIADYVLFYGMRNQAEVNDIYDNCTIAVASLGLHRIGINVASTLKTREYLAKGMPFVYSGEVDVFIDNPVGFCLRVSADDSSVDIEKVIEFHDELYSRHSEEDVISEIRAFAQAHLSIAATMSPVLEYFEEASKK